MIFERQQANKIKRKMTQFMVENGLGLDVFKKESWSELVSELFDGRLPENEIKKVSPSARTITRAMLDDRQNIVQALCLRGKQLVKEGKLSLALDHKKFEMTNEVFSDCLGLLVLLEENGKKFSNRLQLFFYYNSKNCPK